MMLMVMGDDDLELEEPHLMWVIAIHSSLCFLSISWGLALLRVFPFESLVLCGVFWECYSQKLSIWEKTLEACFSNLLFSRYFLLSSIPSLCWCFVWWSLHHLSFFLFVFSVSPFLSVCTTNCHTSFWVSLHLQCVKAVLTHSVCLLCVHSVFLAIAFHLSLSVVVGGFLFFIFGAGCGGRGTTPFCGSFNLHGVAAPLFKGFIFTTTVLRRPLTIQLTELEEFSCEFRWVRYIFQTVSLHNNITIIVLRRREIQSARVCPSPV